MSEVRGKRTMTAAPKTPEAVARGLAQTAYGPKRLYGLQPNGRFAGEVFEERVLAALREARAAALEEAARWQPIETAPRDRYILLCDNLVPRWDGNMEVGKWFGDDEKYACFWSAGGLNGGLELGRSFSHWRELPDDPNDSQLR
jgi:hypothetical protein